MASVTDLYSSLQGYRVRESERVTDRESERVTDRESEREKTSKAWGDFVSTIREQGYVVSEPIERNYFKFLLLILLGTNGI
jgi:hypothetical protein